MSNIPIFLSSDNNYAPFVATTIASICDNTESFVEVYVLDGGISNENQDKIRALKEKFKNFSVEFVDFDKNKYFEKFITNGYFTVATYYRIVISQLYPNIDRFLYLDVDIIVKSDVAQLFNEDLNGCIIGAVKDIGDKCYIKKLKYKVEIDKNHEYFNAGVLLINNKKWIEENITEKLFEIEEKYRGRLECNDQDILNKYFENNYKLLPHKYNSKKVESDTVIRHFYHPTKPWHIHPSAKLGNKLLPDFEIFWKYAQMTQFYDELLKKCKYETSQKIQIQLIYKRLAEQKKKIPVSIIIPVYNTEKYLKKCLDTVSNQSLLDVEIICINDCSTDNSLEIIKDFMKEDDRIKLIDFKENKGVAAARNEGIEIAKGEYVGFVDADDYVDLDFYEKLYNVAKNGDLDIVKGNVITYTEIEKIQNQENFGEKFKDNKMIFASNFWSAIYKKEIIDSNNLRFNINYTNGEDLLFLYNFLVKANKLDFVYNTAYHYIRRPDSLDSDNLSDEAVYSALNARCDMIDLINKSYQEGNLTEKQYVKAYEQSYLGLLYPLGQNNNLIVKEKCAKCFIENYDKCICKKQLWESFPYKFLLELIQSKDLKNLTKEFLLYKKEDFKKKQVLYTLRMNHLNKKKDGNV